MKKFSVVLAILFASYLYVTTEALSSGEDLQVHYIDVGQGDSIFIEFPNNEVMLIDGGEREKGNIVADYIKNEGYDKINYVIATHPHSDHIGGLIEVIDTFEIGNIYMPKVSHTTKTYEDLLLTIQNNGLKIKEAKPSVIFENEDLKLSFLTPDKIYDNLNDNSAVVKLEYGNNSFLFMGDLENEEKINHDVDVVKIGHHGSDTSSSEQFVKNSNALYGIISVGEDNKYNHPSKDVINLWESYGTKVFRTDLCGNIIVTSNKVDIEVECTNDN